jgi:ADP-ribosylglycohydrolase
MCLSTNFVFVPGTSLSDGKYGSGFVGVALSLAFRHLAAGADYAAALTQTLLVGGDTDTNACIVGALVGAAVGAGGIPPHMRQAVRNTPPFSLLL